MIPTAECQGKVPPTADCRFCGEPFPKAYSWKVFCSRRCQGRHNWLTSTKPKLEVRKARQRAKAKRWCRHCGARFKPNKGYYQIYCGGECRREQDNLRKRHGKDRQPLLRIACAVCETVFQQHRPNQKLCGRKACKVEANRVRKKAARQQKRAEQRARRPRPERGDDWVAAQLARLRAG